MILQDLKHVLEKATGIGRPEHDELGGLLRERKAQLFRFKDDGLTPNNPHWPLIVYRSPVRLAEQYDPAAIFEDLFAANGWTDAWRNGIYDYLHYHSHTHEVLGIAKGEAHVQFGGNKGRTIAIKAGDVVVLPAGTGHKRLSASRDLLVVGAYPRKGSYDECRSSDANHDEAIARIAKVPRPARDPVYGEHGPLLKAWKSN